MPIPIYKIKDLYVSNGKDDNLIIKQFEIHRGACYVFEGNIGCGKTSLLNVLYSRRSDIKGEINFEEKDIFSYSKKEYQNQIAVVPQKFIAPWGTVENYILKTIDKYTHVADPEKKLDAISRKMNLNLFLKRKIKTLSPGELRWVSIATNIAADTKVLFIDEYEQHLGKEEINKLNNILYRKINYDGVTLITTTYNKEYIKLFDKIRKWCRNIPLSYRSPTDLAALFTSSTRKALRIFFTSVPVFSKSTNRETRSGLLPVVGNLSDLRAYERSSDLKCWRNSSKSIEVSPI